jgi:hypothetical protein
MKKDMKAFLLRLPAEILIVVAFLASAYLKISGDDRFSWGAAIILLIINILYFWGRNLNKKDSWDF